MSTSSEQFESYVPVYDVVPQKWEDARGFLVETLKKISNAINAREIGFFLDEELLSGKQFIPSPGLTGNSQQFRAVFRKVIDFGALPNAGLKAVPHGINVDSNFTLLNIYAGATDPVALISFSPVYAPATVAASPLGVQMYMNATNVIIETNSNRTSYTRCFIVIEYLLEV